MLIWVVYHLKPQNVVTDNVHEKYLICACVCGHPLGEHHLPPSHTPLLGCFTGLRMGEEGPGITGKLEGFISRHEPPPLLLPELF